MATPWSPMTFYSESQFRTPLESELFAQAVADATEAQKLASEFIGLNRYEEAERLHLRALEVKLRIGCPEASLAISYNSMGAMYTRMGRLDEAKEYLQKALHIREGNSECGKELSSAFTRMYLAKVLEMQGDLRGAKDLRKMAPPRKMLLSWA
ncbi:hypothetical protein EVJ58_g3567 [Rhodofomes roseus]|uniref:Uncharacterized protein n=1 Tax=Rhodofomes roseus TaxID=34475 RepID=A0A4Y9YPF9_9APHY|nr:hypothetical protein EVJ58_g3567 [Rhodofomes roseus]